MLKTRQREWAILDACLKSGQRCIVDNTNPTSTDRAPYIVAAHASYFEVVGYYFLTPTNLCIERNASRTGKARIAEKGIWVTAAKLTAPRYEEGFTRIFHVDADGEAYLQEECAT